MLKSLPIALLLVMSVPVGAQPAPTQASQPSQAKPKSDLDRMVCEKEDTIGTRLGARKVCKTVREWQEQRRIQREEAEKVQQVVNQNPSG
jgi:hypothetical protein